MERTCSNIGELTMNATLPQDRYFIIETYKNRGEPSNKKIRAHPLPGQDVSTLLNVECSAGMRDSHAPRTLFKVRCKVTHRAGAPFLYRHYRWPYEVVTRAEAEEFIVREFGQ